MVAIGKVALITGGASGIGLGIAKQLLKNGAKAVCIVDLVETAGVNALEELHSSFGANKAIFVKADICKDEELENAFKKTVEVYNQLDFVFNNAGIIQEDNWRKIIDVNLNAVLRGTFLAMLDYLPKYKSGEEGIVINTASEAALEASYAYPTYGVSKTALIGIARNFSYEEFYKKYKVKILTFCPGAVRTNIATTRAAPGTSILPDVSDKLPPHLIIETPESIAEKVMKILNKGNNGSVWVVRNNVPEFEVVFPTIEEMTKRSN